MFYILFAARTLLGTIVALWVLEFIALVSLCFVRNSSWWQAPPRWIDSTMLSCACFVPFALLILIAIFYGTASDDNFIFAFMGGVVPVCFLSCVVYLLWKAHTGKRTSFDRKMLFTSTCFLFAVGLVAGVILFYLSTSLLYCSSDSEYGIEARDNCSLPDAALVCLTLLLVCISVTIPPLVLREANQPIDDQEVPDRSEKPKTNGSDTSKPEPKVPREDAKTETEIISSGEASDDEE
jgi:hypothetical protein